MTLSDMENRKNRFSPGTTPSLMSQNNRSMDNDDQAPLNEKMLITRCQSGDMTAFAQLMKEHQDRLFNAVYRMVNNYDDAQELTQEAFVRALQGLKKFRGQAGFYTWLFRIGINLCINYRRRRRPISFSTVQSPTDQLGRQADALLNLPDSSSPAPPRQAQISEMHARVIDALQKLEPPARAIVVLRDIEELDYDQIARILDVPLGTVKSRLSRARLALRNLLNE